MTPSTCFGLLVSLICLCSAQEVPDGAACRTVNGVCLPFDTGLCLSLDSECEVNTTCCDKCPYETKPKCARKGGYCKRSCDINEEVVKKGCKGNKCKCCVECVIEPHCSDNGGYCVSKLSNCPSNLIDESGCQGDKCMCCLPSPTTTFIPPITCQSYDLSSDSGSISVWSEGNYENNLDCQWQITVASGAIIFIYWLVFDLESHSSCVYDYVEVFDEGDGSLLARVCGSDIPSNITSTSNQVLVTFHTDHLVQRNGFFLEYVSYIPMATCSNGTQDLSDAFGSISVWSESNYENNLDCQWQIAVSSGDVIFINWLAFDLESHSNCSSDYVEIYDEGSGNLLRRLCGDVMPSDITSSSNQVLVTFHSNPTVQRYGFTLDYTSHPAGPASCSSSLQDLSDDFGYVSVWSDFVYENNLDCQWRITVAPGNMISISWRSFNLESHSSCNWDYVEVYDEGSESLLLFVCGTTMPSDVISNSNQVLITFHTDFSVQRRGFSFSYALVPAGK